MLHMLRHKPLVLCKIGCWWPWRAGGEEMCRSACYAEASSHVQGRHRTGCWGACWPRSCARSAREAFAAHASAVMPLAFVAQQDSDVQTKVCANSSLLAPL